MKNKIRLITYISTCLLFFGCELRLNTNCVSSNGPIVKASRTPSSFHSISLDVPAELRISQSQETKVTLEGSANILDLIEAESYNGHLKIGSKQCFNTGTPLKILVSLPTLQYLGINGSGVATSFGNLQLQEVELKISGSGEISLPLVAQKIEATIAGSGDISLRGQSKRVEVSISGSGDFDGKELLSEEGEVHISGSGNVVIHSKKRLQTSISGSGSVRYLGQPKLKVSTRGSGTVSPL